MNKKRYYNDLVTAIKKIFYIKRGEPFKIGKKTLHFVPGTRPTKFKYINSSDITVRNDVKQMKYFIDNIKPGNFVLDIGGHTGQYTVLFSSLVSDKGKVVTIEPDPFAKKVLNKNLELNNCATNVVVYDIALSDVNGTHSFFSKGGDSMSSLVKSGLGSNTISKKIQEYKVNTMRLDNFLKINKLGIPDWIKLDTEGAEIAILNGAETVLKSGAVIICELHPYAWAEFGVKYDDLLDLIKRFGRSIKYLDETLKIENGPQYGAVIIS